MIQCWQPVPPIWTPDMSGGNGEGLGGDIYWNDVVLCCNFGGTDGSSTIIDEKSGSTLTRYTPSGSSGLVISTADSVSNGSSLKAVGRGSAYLDVSIPFDTNLTIEFWLKGLGAYISTASGYPIAGGWDSSGTQGSTLGSQGASSSYLVTDRSNTGWTSANWSTSNWNHAAYVCTGRNITRYWNGVKNSSPSGAAGYWANYVASRVFIGNLINYSPSYNNSDTTCTPGLNAYIDCLRITKASRYFEQSFYPPDILPVSGAGNKYYPFFAVDQNQPTLSGSVIGTQASMVDANINTGARVRASGGLTSWLQMDFGQTIKLDGIGIGPAAGTIGGSTCRQLNADWLQRSFDGANWFDVFQFRSVQGTSGTNQPNEIQVPIYPAQWGRYWRIVHSSPNSDLTVNFFAGYVYL